MKRKGKGLYMYTGLVSSVCYNVAISMRCMRGAGAQALACRIAEAHSWSNRQHAVLELDIMLHDNVNMPEVRPEKLAGECLASSGAHGGLDAISQDDHNSHAKACSSWHCTCKPVHECLGALTPWLTIHWLCLVCRW